MPRPYAKAVSINGALYARLEAKCDAQGVAVSSVVDRLLADVIGGTAKPPQPAPQRPKRQPRPIRVDIIEGATPPHGTRANYTRGKCRCDACREANNAYMRGWYNDLAIEVSEETHSMLRDQVVRVLHLTGELTTPGRIADAAINRMLDAFEQFGMGAVR